MSDETKLAEIRKHRCAVCGTMVPDVWFWNGRCPECQPKPASRRSEGRDNG